MSYILDALRKADAERERDPARGIHARPAPALPSGAPSSGLPRWAWIAAAAGVVLLGAYLAWPASRQAPPAPAAAAPTLPVQELAPAAPVAPVAALTVAAAVQPPPPPMPVEVLKRPAAVPASPAPAGTIPQPAVGQAPAAEPSVSQPPVAQPPLARTDSSPAVAAAAAPVPASTSTSGPAPAAATGSERIFAVSELPQEIQRELPKLAITGGVHSENAAQRLLIVGGQLKTEGAELAPGVVLEQIRPRSAVLRFRDLRYSVMY